MELEIIKELIEYDEKKLKEVLEIHSQKTELKDTIFYEEKDLKTNLWQNVKQIVDSKKADIQEKSDNFQKLNVDLFNKEAEIIQKKYDENKKEWLDKMFANCIK